MNIFRVGLLVSMILLFPVLLAAQQIDSMMNVYADNFPQEKLYVQFDKNLYNSGETIWFKAYLFSGVDPSPISKNFYAELSDANGNIIQKKILPLFESTTAGNFDIPPGFKENRLHFRAYTTWMLNFDTAFLYEKDIRLANIVKDSSQNTNSLPNYRFQFFPEGGDVIAGVENNIAFKATDQYGLPIKVTGILKDASGKDVLEFSSVHDGMGKFLITPDKGDSLYALWKDEKGVEHRTDFPQIKSAGVALRVMNTPKKAYFSVARSTENDELYNKLTVIAHMNQQMVYKATVNLKDNFISGGSIPTDQLPSGVLQVTVFRSDNLPVAERVVFVNNHSFEFSSDLTPTSKSIVKRGKNVIDISVPDTISANLSVAITDAEADGKKTNDGNIISGLLLTGDIRGYVHAPGYYFSNASDSVAQHLDLVMLTHGWRRFKWDQLLRGKTPVIKFPVENYVSIYATVLGVDASHIAKEESMNLILQKKDSSIQFMDAPKVAGSRFGISGLIFYDTARAFYQFNVNRKLSAESAVVFDNGLYKGIKKIKPVMPSFAGWTAADSAMLRKNRFIVEETAKAKSYDDKKVQTLASVTVKVKQKTPAEKLDEQYSSGLFSGGDAFVFDILDDQMAQTYTDVFNYLLGRIAGLMITNPGGRTSLQWRGSTPSLYVNEVQADVQQLQNMPMSDIALVKVFRPGTAVGFGSGAGGSIAIYTKRGASKKVDPSIKGLEQTRIIGYSAIRQFYSPDYTQPDDAEIAEDVRSTLYWNPFILTDRHNKKITIQFFNNDISKKLRVVLEGINTDGKLTRIEKILQ